MGYTFYDNNNNNNRNNYRPTRGQPSTGATNTTGLCCGFCKKNRETPQVYLSHRTKDDQGRVACPTLRKYRCPNCGATGDEAHTRSNCPNVVSMRQQQQQQQQQQQMVASSSTSQQALETPAGGPVAGEQALGNRPANDLEFGINRCLANMSSVTSTRYNAAGRLRNRPGKQHGQPEAAARHHLNGNASNHYSGRPEPYHRNGHRFQ